MGNTTLDWVLNGGVGLAGLHSSYVPLLPQELYSADVKQPSAPFCPVDQIIHGDCVEILTALPDACVDLVVTDPPFLVNYRARDGRACPYDNSSEWLRPAFVEIARVLKDNRFCVCFYGWPSVAEFIAAWTAAGFRPVSHLVWVKPYRSSAGLGSSYFRLAAEPSNRQSWRVTFHEAIPFFQDDRFRE